MSDTSREGTLALTGSLVGLCTIAVSLRFYARLRQKSGFKPDDWTAGLALVAFIASGGIVVQMVYWKVLGYSSHDFTAEELAEMSQREKTFNIVHDLINNAALALVKLSALFFYLRIFCSANQRSVMGIVTWTTIIIVTLWHVIFQFLTGFQCGTHFSALWDGTYLEYCTLSFPFLYGLVISDFLLDIWILLLPIPSILRLNTTPRKKASVVGIFLLAFVGLGASIARMVQYIKVELGGPDYLFNVDYQHTITSALFYSRMESGMALIAVNLPSLSAFSLPHSTRKLLKSVKSLSFLRGSQSRPLDDGSDVPHSKKAYELESFKGGASVGPRPSGSSHTLHHDAPLTLRSFLEDPEMQNRRMAYAETTESPNYGRVL